MNEKTYDELEFTDDFLFCNILMANEDLCIELVEMITGRKVKSIVKSEDQKAIPEIRLNDGTNKIFLYAVGDKDDCTEKMKDFLDYIAGRETHGELSDRLKDELTKSRKHEQWRMDFMLLEEKYKEKYDEGFEQGQAKERENTERERQNAERERQNVERERKRANDAEALIKDLEAQINELNAKLNAVS